MAVMPHVRRMSGTELHSIRFKNHLTNLATAPTEAGRCSDLLYLF
jgi:hypothetical protein